jgi:hypothetical protein
VDVVAVAWAAAAITEDGPLPPQGRARARPRDGPLRIQSPSKSRARVVATRLVGRPAPRNPTQDCTTWKSLRQSFPRDVPAVVTSRGIAYKWSSSEGDGEMWPPSVGVTWTEKGLTFKLDQNDDFGETNLAVRPEGTYDTATFSWSASTWLEVPEAVRESVKRAFSAITTRHERDSRKHERIQRERDAALEARLAAARKRILGQLED